MGKSMLDTFKAVLVGTKSQTKAKAKAGRRKKKKDNRPSIAEQINFGGKFRKTK